MFWIQLLGIPLSGDDPPLTQVAPAPVAYNELEDGNDGLDDSRAIESHVKLSKTSCKCSLYLYTSTLD